MVTRVRPITMWQRSVIMLSGTIMCVAFILALVWGRPVLIPIALAAFLTLLLNPVVRTLEERGLGRVFSVLAAVSTASIILITLGGLMMHQIGGMVAELPQNTANIKAKVNTLRALGSGPLTDKFAKMFEEIARGAPLPVGAEKPSETLQPAGDGADSNSTAETIILQAESRPWLIITGYLGSVFEVLATLAFTFVLLVVFLLGRNDLRDRVVLVAGKARLALTSKALEDVTDRISRYILMVAIVNGGFGVLLTAGLFFLQVPYALLWGFLAAGLRFIPYIGPWIGAVFPIAMSLATADGWWLPIAVFGLILALELVSNNVIEPLVFGRSTGVSATTLLISAAFWLYLWGPIGLVLSAPFAVCLVVLGKNIPQLGFLNLLLGDSPAVRSDTGIYLRLIQGDEHEAVRLVLQRMNDLPSEGVFDEMLVPALNFSKRDVHREYLTGDDQQRLLKGLRACLQKTDDFLRTKLAGKTIPSDLAPDQQITVSRTPIRLARILGCPAKDGLDCLGLEMLRQLLDPNCWILTIISAEMLTSELLKVIGEDPPDIICIASLPPGGMAHARYLCKRLRAASPEIQIIVGRWGQTMGSKIDRDRLAEAGASFVTSTLLETHQLLESRFPLMMHEAKTISESMLSQDMTESGGKFRIVHAG